MDEMSEIRLFVRMVAAGNLSETARRLNSSLPAMSRRLAGLEKRLGVRLVDRSTRRFTLTEEGSRYHERAVKILADLDEAEAEISSKVASPQGHIRVGAPLEIGRRQFAPVRPSMSLATISTSACMSTSGPQATSSPEESFQAGGLSSHRQITWPSTGRRQSPTICWRMNAFVSCAGVTSSIDGPFPKRERYAKCKYVACC
jgi:DNA-binding MarR family transcriptional regulator